ncbi:MAG: tripartite tricarboxylate transporter TctB family protein [Betaproteobacteria bacterium]|nr:tripartite tricarboxylate transporter TctB family protein [Betaproteobacteria bacterium]
MSDRLFASLWLFIIALIAWMTWQIEVPFSYEPIGPRAFPWLLCAGMALACVRLMFRPGAEPKWPRGELLWKSALLLVALVGYAFLFEILGFVVATILVSVAVGRSFGGTWRASLIAGVGLGISLWILFDKLLDVTLPVGRIFGGA